MTKSKLLACVSLATGLAVAGTAIQVSAQNLDVIKQRREAMRSITDQAFATSKMFKGEAPFDLAGVQSGLKSIQNVGAKLKDLFPEDSKTGGGTDASAKIWTARADFNAAVDKWVADAKTASAAITDEASFKTGYAPFSTSCGGCHKATDGFVPPIGELLKKPKP